MGASKQDSFAAESPTNIDVKITELAGNKASNARNDSFSKSETSAVIKANAKKRSDVDHRGLVATLEALLTNREDEFERVQSKYGKLKDRCKKLLDEHDTRGNALQECESSRDLHLKIVCNILNTGIHPYATQNGMMPEEWTEESIDKIMKPLAYDALKASSGQDSEP
ncbi:uncharacterized protein M421DRAFT_3830 [Didymella exigua CBS 183.55]|uniref:Uncharacterized protein n=1 Tax=Didymella exigua CBS 183.55 TaxID=1150837 RepID=A0A6A5RQL2_9PLEO|nr:uncharacterized protein M421DRAFT_3830 [Didymella exigua CBS 183.55]KAF1930072.1 hypothetical protein M421DRAFT_3830 [Didymella exigua CBS 183.55]